MKRYGAVTTSGLMSVLIFSAVTFGGAEEVSDTQSMSFTKNIIVKQYKSGEVQAEPYTVKNKDTLWSILVKGYGIQGRQFFFFCRMTKSLNPDLKDADHLEPDQLLLIPYKYIPHFTVPEDILRPSASSLLASRADQIPTEEYAFSEGEHLAQVLRDMYNIPDDLIFDEYLEIVKKLNPEIEDVNLVKAGQKIRLPSVSAYRSVARKDENLSEGAMQGHTIEERPVSAAAVIEGKKSEGSTAKVFLASPLTQVSPYLPSGRDAYMSTLGSLTEVFQGKLHRLGDISIPLMEGSRVTLDTAQFPVLELTPGKRIIVDHGGGLPAGIVDLVELEPGNYEVVTLERHENMRGVLDKLFDAAGYFAVDRSKNPLVVGGEVQFRVSGDWIIYADELIKDIMVVNFIEPGDLPLDAHIKESLKALGVSLIELSVGEKEEAVDAHKPAFITSQPEAMPVMTFQNSPELVDAVLNLLEQPCTKNHILQLLSDESKGFAVDVAADRYFEKEGGRHIVCFRPVAAKLKEVLEGQGYQVLSMQEALDEPISAIKTLLDFMQVPSESPHPGFYDSPGGKGRIGLVVPGILVKHDKAGDILLTPSILDTDVYQWLVSNKVRVFQLKRGEQNGL